MAFYKIYPCLASVSTEPCRAMTPAPPNSCETMRASQHCAKHILKTKVTSFVILNRQAWSEQKAFYLAPEKGARVD
jgi:hypothetical protein